MAEPKLTMAQTYMLRNIVRDPTTKYGLGNPTALKLIALGLAEWAYTDNWRDYYLPLLPTAEGTKRARITA